MATIKPNKPLVIFGMFILLLMGSALNSFVNDLQVWQVDLSRIIANYSLHAARLKVANDVIADDFKASFNGVTKRLPHRVILVDKGHLLSGQKALDRTEWFLTQMEQHNE